MKKKRRDALITKAYLDKRFDEQSKLTVNIVSQAVDRLIKYIDYRLEPLENMAKDYYSFKDKVLTSLDWLIGKYTKFEEEHMILTAKYTDINKRIEKLEDRVRSK